MDPRIGRAVQGKECGERIPRNGSSVSEELCLVRVWRRQGLQRRCVMSVPEGKRGRGCCWRRTPGWIVGMLCTTLSSEGSL